MKEMWKNSAIIAKRNVDDSQNPISVQLTELKQIIDVHSCIVLNQLPDEFYGIDIEGYTEVHDIEKVSGKKFKVDYANGVLYFHPNNIGKMIEISYYGIGCTLLSASRIYTKYDRHGNVLETLEEYIDKAKLYLKAIESLGGAVEVIRKLDEDITTGTTLHENLSEDIEVATPLQTNLRNDINEANTFRTQLNKDVADGKLLNTDLRNNIIEGYDLNSELIETNNLASSNINLITKAGNYIATITSSQWTVTDGSYEYSIKHNLNSEGIVINVIDTSTKEPLQPTCVFVDKNNILLKSDTKREVKVVLSASYYSGGIDSKLEIIDARKGKESLKAKIDDIDTQLEQIVQYNAKNFTTIKDMFSSVNTGGYVNIPIGNYNEKSIILNGLSNLVIEGFGELSRIKFNDLISELSDSLYYSDNQYVHVVINNCKNIKFKNLYFEGVYDNRTTGTYSHGIIVSGKSDNISFENCIIDKFCGEGILNNSSGTVTVNDSTIKNIRNSGIGTNNTGGIKGKNNIIEFVSYQENNSGISVNSEWEFENNTIRTMNVGAKIGHTGRKGSGRLIGNTFEYINPTTQSSGGCFIFEGCDGIDISNNTIKGKFYDGLNVSGLNDDCFIMIKSNKFLNILRNSISSFINKTKVSIKDNVVQSGVNGIVLSGGNIGIDISGNKISGVTEKGIYVYSTGNNKNNILQNIINGGQHGIYISGGNELNVIGKDNTLINQTVKEIYMEISNVFYDKKGNIVDYIQNTTPTLDGTPDNSSQTPSLNNGNFYVLPSGTTTNIYNIVRFDNGYEGQIVNFLGIDAFSIFKKGNNISISADITTQVGKLYSFRCINSKYYLVSVSN